MNRPQLMAMLAFVRPGGTVICHSMDRLGRNLADLRKLVLGLTERGVQVQFLKESLSFTGEDSPMANLLLSVMGAFAQFERELIRERKRGNRAREVRWRVQGSQAPPSGGTRCGAEPPPGSRRREDSSCSGVWCGSSDGVPLHRSRHNAACSWTKREGTS